MLDANAGGGALCFRSGAICFGFRALSFEWWIRTSEVGLILNLNASSKMIKLIYDLKALNDGNVAMAAPILKNLKEVGGGGI